MVLKNKILWGVLGVVVIVCVLQEKAFSLTHPLSGILINNASESSLISQTNQAYAASLQQNTQQQQTFSSFNKTTNAEANQLIALSSKKNIHQKTFSDSDLPVSNKFTSLNTISTSAAATITSSASSGNWSNPTSWSGGVVPGASDDVVIAAGTTILVDANTTCQSITIESGGILQIANSITLTLTGDWTNSGSFDAGTSGIVELTGSTSSTISGTTAFEELIISKDNLSIPITITDDVTVSSGGNLTLTGGLIQVNSGASLNLNYSNQLTIPATAGFEVNGGTLETGNFSINNKGLIRINSGTANFGASSGNSIETNTDGVFEVASGVVNIAGRLRNSAGGTLTPPNIPSGINISGGTINLATEGNGASSEGTLHVTQQGAFSFTGGTIVFKNASTASTALDLSLAEEDGNGTKTTTGGTFQFGESTSTNSTFIVNSLIPLYNIQLPGSNQTIVFEDVSAINNFTQLSLNSNNIELPVLPGGTYNLPIIEGTNQLPVTIQITGGTGVGTLTFSAESAKAPENNNTSSASYLNRHWTIDITGLSGSFSYAVIADFLPAEINGSSANLVSGVYDNTSWNIHDNGSGSINTTTHTLSASGITAPSIILTAINQAPTIVIDNGESTAICEGSSVNLTTTATGDPTLNYAWTSTSAGFTASTADISVTPNTTTNYKVTVTDGNGFTASDAIEVVVNPVPTIDQPANLEVCNNDAASTINFTGTATSYNWTNDNTSIGLAAAGNGNIASFTATNTTTAPIIANIEVAPVYSNGGVSCTGTPKSFTITVNPTPTVDQPANLEVCNNDVTSTINFTGTATSYNWTNNNTSIGLTAAGNGNIVSFTAINTTTAPIVANIEVAPVYSNGGVSCTGTPKSFTITVNPTPTVDQPANLEVCNNDAASTINFTGTATSYNWTNNNTSIGLAAAGNGNIVSFTATNTTTAPIVANIEVAPVYSNGGVSCTGTPKSFTITVNPTPTVISPGPLSYCMGETTPVITLTGSPSNVLFNITGGNTIGLIDRTGVTEIPSFTALPGNATITIIPVANGCEGSPVVFPISVNPLPNIQTPTSFQSICSGENTDIELNSSTPGTTFTWRVVTSGNTTGASDGSGNIISQTLINKTSTISDVVYQITATANGCEGATRNFRVTVHPEVTATISGTATVCQQDQSPTITFNASGGNPPYTFSYTINGGSLEQVTAPLSSSVTLDVPTDIAGNYEYSLVNVTGATNCPYPQNQSVEISILPKPYLTSTLTPPGICSNDEFTYIPESDVPGTTFSWHRPAVTGISNQEGTGNDNPEEYLENTTNSPIAVTYTYTLTTTEGCINMQDVTVMVTPVPHLTSTTSGLTVCSGAVFSYSPTSDVGGTNFPWTRAAVPGITNPAASGTGDPNETLINTSGSPVGVTYVYTLESNNCANPTTYTVPVVVMPAPNVTASASEHTICPGESTNLFSSSDIGGGTMPTTLLNENFNSAASGATSGPNGWTTNGNDNNAWWTVRNNNYYYNIPGPGGVTFSSNDNSRFYLANLNDGSGWGINSRLISPSINTTGYTDLELRLWHYYRSGGNSDHAEIQISTDGSSWKTIEEFYSTQGSSTNFTQYTYDLSGYVGQPSLYIRFRYRGRDRDYFWAIDNISITGTPASVADIRWTSNTSSWTSSEVNPTSVSPSETTTYTVTYTDPDTGCDGQATTTVTLHPRIDATINADYCVNAPKIRLTTGSFDSYNWQPIPHGETNGNQYIDIDIAGIYTVNVTDIHGCTGTASINVSNEYVINGSFENGNTGFSTPPASNGNRYTYVADGPGNSELYPEGLYSVGHDAQDYHPNFWGFDHTSGTGNFMIVNGFPGSPQPIIWQQTITNLQPNTTYYFSAWAISLNNVGNDAQLQFSINGQQLGTIADLTAIRGINSNQNPWDPNGRFYGTWNSGNNTSAVLSIVDLQTATSGNDFGIDDISFGILDPAPADIAPSKNSDICAGETIELYANVTGGKEPITYLWTGPNGFSSTEANPSIQNAEETYSGTYTLQITDWYGCQIDPETVDVTVYPQTYVNAGPDQPLGCSADIAFQLQGNIGGSAENATWSSSGTGSFADPTSLQTTYTASQKDIETGTITLTLTTNDPSGPCSANSDDMIITIHDSPELTIDKHDPPCYGENTGWAEASVINGAPSYSYLWSDGQTTQKAINLIVGNYSVTVTDQNGCTDYQEFSITEPDALVVYPATFTPPTCYGENDGTATINITGGTSPYIFQWDAAANNQTTQTATNLSVGTYMFTVTDINGCNITTDFILVTQPDPPVFDCSQLKDITVQADIGENYASDVATNYPDLVDLSCQTLTWEMTYGGNVFNSGDDSDFPSTYTFRVGTTTINFTTTNLEGGQLSCEYDVIVTANDPPEITCADDITRTTDADVCSATFDPGIPTLNTGTPPISWTWTITNPDGTTQTGSSTGNAPDPSPTPIGNYEFQLGITTITWRAQNVSGFDECTQSITITDGQEPVITSLNPIEECVEALSEAIYYPPTIDINPTRPDYFLFEAGSTSLDLDLTTVTDNCAPDCDYSVRWQIDFSPTPDPVPPHNMITQPSLTGTGQLSTYTSDIKFPGDGVNFTNIVHTITYWVEDCNGNESAPKQTTITITPRPNIIKMN